MNSGPSGRPSPARYLLYLFLLPSLAPARLSSADPEPLGLRLPVVLIHGWNADERSWDRLAVAAGRHEVVSRRCKLYRFSYDWSQAIAASADRLRAEVGGSPELRGRPLVLVGHSMGGLVARAWMESGEPDSGLGQAALLITLGTPHHGSPQANLEWLSGDSRYSLLAKLLPLGLVELVDRIPIARAARTEGGRDLGWDNYDGAMPAEIWAGSSRYLRLLNDQLERHPQRDELLLRYSFHAGALASVAPLSVLRLQQQLRAGDHYAAGASLLAHAFNGSDGRPLNRWALNDGAVPLDSALFLRPGGPLGSSLAAADLNRRARLAAVPVTVSQGVDHGRLISDQAVLRPVLEQLATVEPDSLALRRGDELLVYTPGARWPPPATGVTGQPLGAPRADLVLAVSGDALAAVGPGRMQPLARTEAAGRWLPSPDGGLALTPDGALVGLLRPCYRRLPAFHPESVVWSADGQTLALSGSDGSLLLVDAETLRVRQAAAARPVSWSPDGQRLVADAGGVDAACWRGDGGAVALVLEPARPATALLLGQDGSEQGRWIIPASNSPGPRLVVVTPGSRSFTAVAAAAQQPGWAPNGSWLAWRDGEGRIGFRRNTVTTTLSASEGRVADLAISRDALMVARLELATGGCGLAVAEPGSSALRLLASTPTAGRGPVLISPSGRHALCLVANGVLLASLDGALRTVLAADYPVWLPSPAARGWTMAAPGPTVMP